jgi:dipeptidyl aminopeptidase/acylaminoacyl peptidase
MSEHHVTSRRTHLTYLGAMAAGAALILGASPGAARERLTPEALMTIPQASQVTLSPDGSQVAYVIESADPTNFATRYSLLVGPSTNITKAREVVSGAGRAPQLEWAANGESLFYLSSESGLKEVWTVSSDGSNKRQVTNYPVDVVAFMVPRNGRTLLTAHDVFPDCPTLACTKQKIAAEAARKDSGQLYSDGQAPRFFSVYGDDRFVNLFSSALSANAMVSDATPLTPGLRYDVMESAYGLQWDISVTPDGTTAYFATRPSGSNQGDELPKTIYRVDMAGGTASSAMISDEGQSVYSPRVSPDGRRLAYLKADGTTYTAPRVTAWVRDLVSGKDQQVGGDLDILISNLSWSSDSATLYASGAETGATRLFSFQADGKANYTTIPVAGSVTDFSIAGSKLAYIHSSFTTTPEIAVVDRAKPSRVIARSNFAPQGADRFDLGEVVKFDFPGWNGEPVEGFLVKPAGFDPGKKYPVILNMHGGPNGAFADRWDSGVGSVQLLAAKGYAVVMFNPHGSSGYGTAFGQSVLGHWGDRPLVDLKAGWAHAVKSNAFLDTDRACAMGGSYGGYLTLLIAGQWNEPWKCLVERAGIFDIRSFMYGNDITAYDKLSFVAEPWLDTSFESQNPVTYVKDWKVPIFIFAGGLDYRVPLDQSISAYGAARLRNIPSKFLFFPNEPHGIGRPHNALRQFEETLSWFDQWIKPGQ